MSRVDRYDVEIRPVGSQTLADRIVAVVGDWTDRNLQHDWIRSTRTLLVWGERRQALGATWTEAHDELVTLVRSVGGARARVEIASRWWNGDRAPDETFTTGARSAQEQNP